MGILVSAKEIEKSFRMRTIFSDLSLTIEDGDRIGLIGPNGAGKSSLLKILAKLVEPDDGELTFRRNLRVSYVHQEESFKAGLTVEEVLNDAVKNLDFEDYEKSALVSSNLKKFGFADSKILASKLSGGWKKRLNLASGLVKKPDLLLLDEPTNHLDLESIYWLESFLQGLSTPYVVISHDRAFLESVTNRVIELNPRYPLGFLNVKGSYHDFLVLQEEKVREQENLEKSLASKVRREIAWLEQGAKARETKSSHRQAEAEKLIEELAQTKERNLNRPRIDAGFQSSGRKTKELINGEGISKGFGGSDLFSDLDILITPKSRLGLVGNNGSGKTTLLKILTGDSDIDQGKLKRASDLKIVWFEQNRDSLDQEKSLKESFNHDGDYVEYCGRKVHVSSWAKKFAFRHEQLDQPISYLSGGEQSRILIANLMLELADILILDEPTNDLDIQTLEVLEDCIEEFPGAVILVSHDRMMLDAVSNELLVLSGRGSVIQCSSFEQCESVLEYWSSLEKKKAKSQSKASKKEKRKKDSTGLSSKEKRDLKELPLKIEEVEEELSSIEEEMNKPEIASQFEVLEELVSKQSQLKEDLAKMYELWQNLEDKASSLTE